MGYEKMRTNIDETGILAEIQGKENSPCILFRADMDAVVMNSNNRLKHTCGHDAHMAIMLALAELLIKDREKLKGSVKILFQPAEEGRGGAKPMIKNGILENPKVDKVFAIHVWSELDECAVGIKSGAIMASTDPFNITVYGKGGHRSTTRKNYRSNIYSKLNCSGITIYSKQKY